MYEKKSHGPFTRRRRGVIIFVRKNLTETFMLKELRVRHFKSIDEEQVLSMEACPQKEVSEHPEHVLNIGGQRLLKVASFYGPNGGGKTNLLDALLTMVHIVYGHQLINYCLGEESNLPCVFSRNKISGFDIFFINEKYELGYSIDVDLTKTIKKFNPISASLSNCVEARIVSEELMVKRNDEKEFTTIYTRHENGTIESDVFESIDIIRTKRPLQPMLSFLKYYIDSFANDLSDYIFSLHNEFSSILALIRENRNYVYSFEMVSVLKPHLNQVTNILNGLDFRISKLAFKQLEPGKYSLCVYRVEKDGKETALQLANESNGTKKIVNIIFDVLSAKGASIFIADDFDSHLHPKLIRAIIELFTSKDNVNKQLIFNSHDMTNMNNEVFRRDEIWFAYRNEDFATQYIPLSNIVNFKGEMVRKDAKYGKQYLEGRYGADPYIKQGLNWGN